jgi:hypothetical protein
MSRRKGRPSSVLSLNTGCGARATHHNYPVRTPVLALDFGAMSVLVTTSGSDQVTAGDVEFARQLAHEASLFARSVAHKYRTTACGQPNGQTAGQNGKPGQPGQSGQSGQPGQPIVGKAAA